MLGGDLLQVAAIVAGTSIALLALVLTAFATLVSIFHAMPRSEQAKRGEVIASVFRLLGQDAIMASAALGLALLAIVTGDALLVAAAFGALALSGSWIAYFVIVQSFAYAGSALSYSAILQVAGQGSNEARAEATQFLAGSQGPLGPVAEREAKAILAELKARR